MENLNDKIVKVELEITDNVTNDQREIIEDYWAYNEYNYELNKLPSQITMKYRISQKELNDTVATFSDINLYIRCDYCDTVERNTFTSQKGFRRAIAQLKKLRGDKYKCVNCQAIEEAKIRNHQESESKERADKHYKMLVQKKNQLEKAVDRKKWKNLSEFENVVLKNAILLNNFEELKNYYLNLGIQSYKKMFSVLRILEAEGLLVLEFDEWDKTKIVKYEIYGRLRENYEYQPKLQNVENVIAKSETNSSENKLELTLSATENQFHPDCPPLGATFNVNDTVVFKPGEQYSCNFSNELNGGVSIKISQVKDIKELPTHIRLDALPAELRKQVEDFLRSNDNEHEA